MNSMFPVWTLSSLILSYTLAFPIYNNSRGSYMESFPNVTEIMEHDKTRFMENMETFPNVLKTNQTSGPHMEIFPKITERNTTEYIKTNPTNRSEAGTRTRLRRICFLSTCSLLNLGSSLQTGNEIAGDMTSDPMGIGKK